MSRRVISSAVSPLIAEMKQVFVAFLSRIGRIWLRISGSRSIVTERKMKSLSSTTCSRLFVADTFGERRGTLSMPPRRRARSSVRCRGIQVLAVDLPADVDVVVVDGDPLVVPAEPVGKGRPQPSRSDDGDPVRIERRNQRIPQHGVQLSITSRAMTIRCTSEVPS